jgi:glucose/arabinose dehydrogenase
MPQTTRLLALVSAVIMATSLLASAATAASSRVSLDPILTGYSRPVLVTWAPGSSNVIFIVEQTGLIKRATFQAGRWRKLGMFLDLRSRVNDPSQGGNERGLLGLAFHPQYARNGLFYVNYTRAGRGGAEGDTVIAEYRRKSAAKADPTSRRVLLTIDQPYSNHNGGHLGFGPDGYLYIGTGDGGGGGDPQGNGQRLDTRLGKLLRIDPRDPDGAGPRRFGIPRTNPRVGRPGLDEIWAWGLRNPWRFSFDRASGDLWIGDVGQGAREEVNRSRADRSGRNAGRAANYGWNRCEGTRSYPDTGSRCRLGSRPVHDYAHGKGRCSVTGGYVHRGPDATSWRGLYVAGDYCGRLFVLDGLGRVRLSQDAGRNLTSFGEDAAGRIFATDLGGAVYQLRFSGPRP